MISRTAEYALRAVLYLARVEDRRPVPVDDIAGALGAPRNYLSKTLNELARLGIANSQRGPAGGFWLNADPETLTVAALIEPFDDKRTSGMCLLGGRICDEEHPCGAHQLWSAAQEAARASIADLTIAQLIRTAPALEFDNENGRPLRTSIPA
ncbi:MAG TPA: Rrf2 family transcriptional regulator [Gemmatimonadales bacterium]|nr:Rrf2 family transcriptional regulator [Gemmatimonadales bacterium]